MTATMPASEQATALWKTMPGWGIAADLTPPELISSRHLKVLQKLMALGLVAVLLVCAGGYFLARHQKATAEHSLTTAQAQSLQLQAQANAPEYKAVTQIQTTVTQIQGQVAGVMTGDVDLVHLMTVLRTALPSTMTIDQESLTVSPAGAAATAGTGTSSTGLDTSGLTHIGTVTIGGNGHALTDLATYVDRLRVITGVVDVTPISNTVSKKGTAFNLTLGLTTAVLSHRFDTTTKGTK